MRNRKVILKPETNRDLQQIRDFVSSIYFEASGIKFIKRMFLEIAQIGFYADAIPPSRFRTVQEIHPEAKTLSIMKHRWTVVFHIEGDYVVVDRILPSSSIAG